MVAEQHQLVMEKSAAFLILRVTVLLSFLCEDPIAFQLGLTPLTRRIHHCASTKQTNTNNGRATTQRLALFHGPAVFRRARGSSQLNTSGKNQVDDGDDTPVDWEALSAELMDEDEDDGLNSGDWLPDREKERQRKSQARLIYAERVKQDQTNEEKKKVESTASSNRPSPYTEEEEDVIASMGGKTFHVQRRREPGFLGDSTLQEIATDYSVPISYIADVLAMWGVPVPIDVHEQLGNLCTGEQAFALLEAVNSLDVSQLHDRYSNTNILNLCEEWDIDLRAAFEMAMKEGWSLPFGIRTCLRVEQEDELLRVLGDQGKLDMTHLSRDEDDF